MKHINLVLVIIFLFGSTMSYAAFPSCSNNAGMVNETPAMDGAKLLFKGTQPVLSGNNQGAGYGIGSFVAALLSNMLVVLSAIAGSSPLFIVALAMSAAAIVLGAMGFNKKLKGLAIAGFVYGLLVFLPLVLLLVTGSVIL